MRVDQVAPYAWWLLVGALAGLGIAGILTIGLPLLLLAALLTWIGLRSDTLVRGVAAMPAGLALLALYLAWLNRGGPGDVCRVDAQGTTCDEEWSPWPFVALAVVLLAVSVVAVSRRRSSRRARD